MKNMLNLGLLAVLVVFATGCAQSHYQVAMAKPPQNHFTKLPREATEDQIKMAQANDLALLKTRIQLECPDEADKEKVGIAYRIGPDISRILIVRFAEVRAFNPYSVPVDIDDDAGTVVKNLCPGGRVTLRSFLDPYGTDGQYKTVSWTAIGRSASGTFGTATSPSFNLYVGDYEVKKVQQGGWTIRFQTWPSTF